MQQKWNTWNQDVQLLCTKAMVNIANPVTWTCKLSGGLSSAKGLARLRAAARAAP